jgi:hypothetical protein
LAQLRRRTGARATAGRSGFCRLWTEGARRVALRPLRARNLTLARQFLGPQFAVMAAGQRREERDQVVDLRLRQRQRLDVLVEMGILQTIALVVVIDDIPQRLLRAVVKVRTGHQYVADVRCLEGGSIGLLLAD